MYSLAITLVEEGIYDKATIYATDNGAYALHLARVSPVPVIEPCDKERIEPRHVDVAPANYHMEVERDGFIALSVDEKISFSRPSIDVLLESAAHVWGKDLIAVILSGANFDGTEGIRIVLELGGMTIAQDPVTAEHPVMHRDAIEATRITKVLSPRQIGSFCANVMASTSSSSIQRIHLSRGQENE